MHVKFCVDFFCCEFENEKSVFDCEASTSRGVAGSPIELMQFEDHRYKSFEPYRLLMSVSPTILAETGFYYIGPGDRVKCYFCYVEISQWSDGDDEVIEHFR